MRANELPDISDKPIKIGSSIYLIRKISLEVLEVSLESISSGAKPYVEVRWNNQHHYRLDLIGNKVNAIDSTTHHRQSMLAWYVIWEPHREKLIQLYQDYKKRKKKYGEI